MPPIGSDRQEPTGAGSAPVGFDYELPQDRIAQEPPAERDGARLMIVDRGRVGHLEDSTILDLPSWLRPEDLLVVNRSRVIPARLRSQGPGGGKIELLLLHPIVSPDESPRWRAICRPGRRIKVGQRLVLRGAPEHGEVPVDVIARTEGAIEVAFPARADVLALTERFGETPLPPYVRRPEGPTEEDRERYQTVFAREPGSIAAPTAGLHLSEPLLERIRARGTRTAEVILHVGPATFLAGQPGRSRLAVEPERYAVPAATREAIQSTRGRGRVVAVGTTTTRALESAAGAGWPEELATTDLVLRPGSSFAVVDALLTNFHLPGSSLLALVSGFAGTEVMRAAYQRAVATGYRFYSYGDAMLIV